MMVIVAVVAVVSARWVESDKSKNCNS
jgi:hypothetical protein